MSAPPFERTTCACKTCTQCCIDQPGPLAPGNLERIAEYLNASVDDIKHKFWASPGAVIKVTAPDGTQQVMRIGTITPKRVKTPLGRRCIFLDENNRCSIHSVAPFGCAYLDTHMSKQKGVERGRWLIAEQLRDKDYAEVRKTLDYATSYKPRAY